MSTCEAWARFHEDDVQFDVECDVTDDQHFALTVGDGVHGLLTHHDPDLGDWDREAGLHDRSLTPVESRLLR